MPKGSRQCKNWKSRVVASFNTKVPVEHSKYVLCVTGPVFLHLVAFCRYPSYDVAWGLNHLECTWIFRVWAFIWVKLIVKVKYKRLQPQVHLVIVVVDETVIFLFWCCFYTVFILLLWGGTIQIKEKARKRSFVLWLHRGKEAWDAFFFPSRFS